MSEFVIVAEEREVLANKLAFAREDAPHFIDIDIYFYQYPAGEADAHRLATREFKYYLSERYGLHLEQWEAAKILEEALEWELEYIRADWSEQQQLDNQQGEHNE